MYQDRMTRVVPIYDILGGKQGEIDLPEKIMPIPAKRGGFSETGVYYKGAGIVYRNHLTDERHINNADVVGKTGIIYEDVIASYPHLVGKFGIFLFPHQVIFSDYEGACGKKEQRIILNQERFEKTAIKEIVNVIPTGLESHNIYAYRMKEVKGGIEDTINLIEYVLTSDYNAPWDKNLWGDIYAYGYVRDIADWFVSNKLEHKLGTVYALLNSLYRTDLTLYANLLLKILGEYSFEKNRIVIYSARIVERYVPSAFLNENVDLNHVDIKIFDRLLHILFSGMACCHLEDAEKWNWVYDYYSKIRLNQVKKFNEK